MSDFNGFYNQTPPDDGNRPDYSYNWNGKEQKNKNNSPRLGMIVVISIVVLAIVCTAIAAAGNVLFRDDAPSADSSEIGSSSYNVTDDGSVITQTTSRPDYSVPDFTPSPDSDTDLSTDLTKIYEQCAPSCCTVSVSVGGKAYAIGSGFVIDAENGYIATNHHVISDGDELDVIFYNGEKYKATLVGSNSTTDLAVLKIEATDLVQVKIGNSDNIKIGEGVVAIGTPYDISLAGTMTYGIISGVARGVEVTNDYGKVVKTMTLIQTDCSINPGNSGGPLIDMAGNVVGITSMKLVDESFESIGFAIPITAATEIFQKLIAGEAIVDSDIAVATPKIGVTVYDLSYGLSYFRMNPRCEYPEGILVGDIEIGSSAYIAGLTRFDIITKFGDKDITSLEDLSDALSSYKAGNEVTVTVFRFNRNFTSGEELSISFNLDAAE